MRCFLALDLPDAVRDALEPVLGALPERVVSRENLHLTLAFLDEQGDAALVELDEALGRFRVDPFELQLSGLGTFGRPDVVWAGVREAGAVSALEARLRAAIHGAGIVLPRRRFRPHVTLSRLSPPVDTERLARVMGRWSAFPSPPWEVSDVVLYQSILTKAEPVYQELARYPA